MIESIETGRAIRWVSDSLAQGSRLSRLVQHRVNQMKYARILGAPDSASYELNDTGHGVPWAETYSDAVRFLEASREVGFRTLLVEDDMARKGDPHLPVDAGFIDDRVLRWTEIGSDPASAARFLRDASTGFPLNAFITLRPVEDMDALKGSELDSLVESICADVGGIIVSVFDGESFLTMSSGDFLVFDQTP